MKRVHLQKWRNSRERLTPSPKEAESGSAVASPPTASTQDAAESGVFTSALSQHEIQKNSAQNEVAAAPKDAPEPQAVATAAVVAGPLTPPPNDDDIPALLDRRPLSPPRSARVRRDHGRFRTLLPQSFAGESERS